MATLTENFINETKNSKELSQEEINERVAILKRFRHLLEQQRNKFKEYLVVLEKQEQGIKSEDDTVIVAQAELEQQIVSNITNLQKVIVPIENMYKEKGIALSAEIPQIQKELTELQKAVLTQNEKNQSLLKEHMIELKNRISNFSNPRFNPYAKNTSIYSQKTSTPSIIDVEI
ncbi:MAG: flagellar biosynthesis protein FlgN [Treponemataceae bacterium]|nr:flagellar biosynthesis protein FlgN [Treponemataceae bacterium]